MTCMVYEGERNQMTWHFAHLLSENLKRKQNMLIWLYRLRKKHATVGSVFFYIKLNVLCGFLLIGPGNLGSHHRRFLQNYLYTKDLLHLEFH